MRVGFFPGQALNAISEHTWAPSWALRRPYPWSCSDEHGLCMEPQDRLPTSSLRTWDFFLSPHTCTVWMRWGQSIHWTHWPLSALAHISPFHTKVLSAFELLILRDAHHFMLAWKMECKVPGDWFVLSCPSDSSPWQYSIEHYDVIENSWTTKLLWARHPTQRLRYIKKMFGTSK